MTRIDVKVPNQLVPWNAIGSAVGAALRCHFDIPVLTTVSMATLTADQPRALSDSGYEMIFFALTPIRDGDGKEELYVTGRATIESVTAGVQPYNYGEPFKYFAGDTFPDSYRWLIYKVCVEPVLPYEVHGYVRTDIAKEQGELLELLKEVGEQVCAELRPDNRVKYDVLDQNGPIELVV